MSIYWHAKFSGQSQRAAALVLLAHLTMWAQSQNPVERPVTVAAATVARTLSELADDSRDSGDVVRAYLLYAEAAKRDSASKSYRYKRDSLEPVAKILMRSHLEHADIRPDLRDAERSAAAGEQADGTTETPHRTGFVSPEAPPVDIPAFVPLEVAPPMEVEASDEDTYAVEAAMTATPGPSAPPMPDAPMSAPPAPVHAETTKSFRFNYAIRVLGYGTYNGIQANSIFNPNNALANLPWEDFHLAVRPDLSLAYSILSLNAKPRLDYDHPFQRSVDETTAYLQEWTARIQPVSSLTLSYGREVLMWGPAMSVPASNPFFSDNGRNTPLVEVGGRTIARMVWQPDSRFALSYIANTGLGRGVGDYQPFRKTAAVKADYIGHSLLVSGIYSSGITQPFGMGKFVGGYIQQTIGQAVRVYAEGSAQEGSPVLLPAASQNPLGWQWTPQSLRGPLKPRTIVGGLAYTDAVGGTWTGEYIYNGAGYDSIFASNYFGMAQDLSSGFLAGGATAQLAAQELAEAREPGSGLLLRRHYAFAQYQRNGLPGRFDVVLRYTLSADDRSGQGVAYFTWNASDHFQVLGIFAGMNGSMETEFARYLHYQAQLGVRFFVH